MSTTQQQQPALDAIVEQQTISTWLDCLDTLVEEAKVDLRDDGIHSAAVDPANAAMVKATLDASAFESFTSTGGTQIGIRVDRLQEAIGYGSADDLVHLSYDPEHGRLVVEIDTFEAEIALIRPETVRDQPDLPDDLDRNTTVELNGGQLTRAIKQTQFASDYMAVSSSADPDTIVFRGEGDTDTATVSYPDDYVTFLEVATERTLLSLDYLSEMESAWPADAAIEVTLGTDMPFQWSWTDCDGSLDAEMLLAPRIDRSD